jgi:hypothetical protein
LAQLLRKMPMAAGTRRNIAALRYLVCR